MRLNNDLMLLVSVIGAALIVRGTMHFLSEMNSPEEKDEKSLLSMLIGALLMTIALLICG